MSNHLWALHPFHTTIIHPKLVTTFLFPTQSNLVFPKVLKKADLRNLRARLLRPSSCLQITSMSILTLCYCFSGHSLSSDLHSYLLWYFPIICWPFYPAYSLPNFTHHITIHFIHNTSLLCVILHSSTVYISSYKACQIPLHHTLFFTKPHHFTFPHIYLHFVFFFLTISLLYALFNIKLLNIK